MAKTLFGLFEVEDNGSKPLRGSVPLPHTSIPLSTLPPDVNAAELVNVAIIYEKAGLSDISKSILKALELKSALPAMLATDVAKTALDGIITAAGLNKGDCIIDGQSRINALQDAGEAMAKSALDTITQSETEISDLKAQITALEEKINGAKKTQEEQERSIIAEIEKINGMIQFLS
jgi:hypothetical protein